MSADSPLLLKIERVGDCSWACIGSGDDAFHSYGSNQGIVQGRELCLVVDSGFHTRTAAQVLRQVHQLHAKRVVVLNTHYHSDHVFGNVAFAGRGSVVFSHEKCRRSMSRLSHQLLSAYRKRNPRLAGILEDVEVSLPSVTYEDRVAMFLDRGIEVELIHPGGRAHTDGDSMVYVPGDRVVFAGDVLWVGYHPNLEDSDIRGQVQALKIILKLRPQRIVPGHGPVCGTSEVRRFIRYLEQLDQNVRRGLGSGLGVKEAAAEAIPAWARGWKMKGLVESYVRKVLGEG